MKLISVPRQRNNDDNLIPLINIVFLLLIFFMLAGTLSSPDGFEVTPPQSLSSVEAEEKKMVVLLSDEGRLAIGEREIDMLELEHMIKEHLSEEPDLQVQLKADGRLTAHALIDVMEIFRAAGLNKLSLLTTLEGT